VPTQKEIDERKRNLEQADEIERIEKLYPLPVMNALKFEYAATPAGKIMVFHRGVNEKGKEFFVPVSTPFGVPARLRYLDDADAYGLRCHVQDMNGVCRPIDLERCKLAKNAGADIREMLFKAGLRTEGAGEMIVIAALKAADPGQEILIVKRPGWHAIAGCPHQIFVAPDGEVIGAPEGLNLELAQSAKIPPGIAKSGDLEGWRATVGIAISAENTPHWTLGILAGFAAPFLSLAGLDTCGISLSGRTTLGKTLAERLGVSAWSLADLTRKSSLLQSARTTDNSAEARAQLSNGSIFALDELAHVDGRTLSKMIYTFAGGVGKSRMNQSADLRDSYHWTTFVILSCEISLDEKIRGDGGDWAGGMAVRFPDIDVTGVNGAVDREIITRVENDLHRHHGHAGPAFVRALVAHGLHQDPSALRERNATMARRLVDGANDEPDDANDDNSPDRNAYGAMTRAALPLAVLAAAGELARQFGLIPAKTPVTEAVQWAWNQFKKSSGAEILQPEEQAIANLRGWTLERWDVTVKPLDREKDNNRETLGWYDENAVYIPRKQIFEACGKIIKESHIGAMLHRRELLHATDRDRFTLKWVPRLGKNIVYALVFEEVGCEAKPKAEPEPQNRFFNGAYRWGRTG
jgi:hypothetical protein